MAVGFKKSGGTDLDSIFMAYQSGTKAALTGFKNSAGTDLRDIYQPFTTGSQPAATGFKISGGSDLSTLFQDINSPLFSLLATTPGGYIDHNTIDPTAANAQLKVDSDGYIKAGGLASGTPQAFGTATGAGIATGKYWKWTYVSGSTPTTGSTTQNTWTAVGSGQVNMYQGSSGTRSGVVKITLANDASGNGATTGGDWTLYAYVEL